MHFDEKYIKINLLFYFLYKYTYMSNTEQMTMEKFNEMKRNTETTKMTQAILGQSQEKGNVTSVFKTEVERESYLFGLSFSESTMNNLNVTKEQFETAKANIRSDVKEALTILREALTILRETLQGGSALNYKKREEALKKINDMEKSERMKQQAEMFQSLKGEKITSPVAEGVKSIEVVSPVPEDNEEKDGEISFDGRIVMKKNEAGILEPFNGEGHFSIFTLSQNGIFENGQIVSGTIADETEITPTIYKGTWSSDDAHLFTGTATMGEKVTKYENGIMVEDIPKEEIDSVSGITVEPAQQPSKEVKTSPSTIQDTIEWIHNGKYELIYDEISNQVRIMKGKRFIRYFTVGNEENAKFDITKNPDTAKKEMVAWLKRRKSKDEQKIYEAKQHKMEAEKQVQNAKNPDKHPDAEAVLRAVRKIDGLEDTTSLGDLGFIIKDNKLIAPEWIRVDSFRIASLVSWHEIKDNKLVQKYIHGPVDESVE